MNCSSLFSSLSHPHLSFALYSLWNNFIHKIGRDLEPWLPWECQMSPPSWRQEIWEVRFCYRDKGKRSCPGVCGWGGGAMWQCKVTWPGCCQVTHWRSHDQGCGVMWHHWGHVTLGAGPLNTVEVTWLGDLPCDTMEVMWPEGRVRWQRGRVMWHPRLPSDSFVDFHVLLFKASWRD